MSIRILVTGSRNLTERDLDLIVGGILGAAMGYTDDEVTIVHGGCHTGADALADAFATGAGFTPERHPADWRTHGKAAGPIRNQHMVDLGADVCLAFPLPGSKGTRDCVRRAAAAGIPVRVVQRPVVHRLTAPAPAAPPEPVPVCPECGAGKCGNCDGTAWDDTADEPTACRCTNRVHTP